MFLSELFEYKYDDVEDHEIQNDERKQKTFDLILPMLTKMLDNNHHFSDAITLLGDKIGRDPIMSVYLELRDAIKKIPEYKRQISEEEVVYERCDCEEVEVDEAMAWGKKGNTVVRKFRCMSGRKKGLTVSKPGDCFKPVDVKKRATLRKTKARMGSRMARKAKKTKRNNPASKRVKALNKK